MSLRLIASYDDLIQLCGFDTVLAEKFTSIMETREEIFDPILSCASNPDLLVKGHFFTRKGKECKRSLHTFDPNKYTKLFIKLKSAQLTLEKLARSEEVVETEAETEEEIEAENKQTIEIENESKDKCKSKLVVNVVRSGFDAYAYLMKYEKEINELYSEKSDLSKLQKAALYFIESGSQECDIDPLKYVASYDDLSLSSMENKPEDKDVKDWLPECGNWHYEHIGRQEILSGHRSVNEFFDATKYIASYPETYDAFKSEDGTLNEIAATIAWISFGISNGLTRNQFSPMVYLANNPDLCKEDIYSNKKVDENKVAKKWLDNFSKGIELSNFDVEDFKESNELKDDEDPFKIFVERKIVEFQKELKKSNSPLKKLGKLVPGLPKLNISSMFSCGSSAMKKTVDSPVEEEKLIEDEEESIDEKTNSFVEEPEEVEPETIPELELSLDELQQQLKETQSKIAVFDTKQELETAKKKLQKLESKKK